MLVVGLGVGGCGGGGGAARPAPRPGEGQGPGAGIVRAAPAPADAGPADAALAEPADAGAGASADLPDAGMADLGIAECDTLFGRVMVCPAIAEDAKKSLAASLRRWHAQVHSREERESIGAACRDMARQLEPTLLKLGC